MRIKRVYFEIFLENTGVVTSGVSSKLGNQLLKWARELKHKAVETRVIKPISIEDEWSQFKRILPENELEFQDFWKVYQSTFPLLSSIVTIN